MSTLADYPELSELLSALRERQLRPEQSARLNQLLREDPEARRLYVRHFHLVSTLHWLHDRLTENAENVDWSVTTPRQTVTPPPLPAAANRLAYGWSRMLVAICFYGLFALMAWNLRSGTRPPARDDLPVAQDTLPAAPRVATVADSTGVQWQTKELAKGANSPIRAGERLQIAQGLIELKLEQGVTLLIKGPARWTVEGGNRARLEEGRLVATVPAKAVGFVLQTPTATIVDLGTEFGVEASRHQSKVHVLKGEVAVSRLTAPLTPEIVRLTEGETVLASEAEILRESKAQADRWADQFSQLKQQRSARSRPFRETFPADPACLAYYDFVADPQRPDTLVNRAQATRGRHDGLIHGARWTQGNAPDRSALEFRKDDWVEVNIPGEFNALTLIASVRLAPAHQQVFSGLVMSNGWAVPGQVHWQISDRTLFRLSLHPDVDHFSSSPVQADRWLMTAAVCDTVAGKVVFYTDGALDGEYALTAATRLRLGPFRIGHWLTEPGESDPERGLHGSVEKLVIFSRTLESTEIRQVHPY